MARLKNREWPVGWIAVAAGVAVSAMTFAGGFIYAGTLDSPIAFTATARLVLFFATALVGAGVLDILRKQGRDSAALRDAVLLGGALAALSWVALVRPALGDPDTSFVLFRIGFAVLDVAIAAGLALLAIPNTGFRMRRVRVAGMVHVAATTVYVLTGLRSSFSFTSPLVVTYLGLYAVLFGMGLRGHLQRLRNVEGETEAETATEAEGAPTRAHLRNARFGVLAAVPVVSGLAVAIAVASEPRGSAVGVATVAAVLMTLAAVRLRELHSAESKLVDSLRDQCDELAQNNAEASRECERALASLKEASDFLADMTERVASPLNGVLEVGDELREAMASAPHITAPVDKLVASSDTLLFIINDLLGISEAAAPPQPVRATAFAPRESVTAVGESFVDAAARRGLDLVVDVDDDVPALVTGQQAHIEKLLGIFIDNAVQNSSKGEIELTTTFIHRDRRGRLTLRFAVRDKGIGMSREHRQALLSQPVEPELTVRRYRCKPHGLALVPALSELLGGTWGVESKVGRGSTFWFSAVLEPATAEVAAAPTPPPTPPPAAVPVVEAHEPEPVVVFEAPEPEPVVVFDEPKPEPEPEPEPEPVVVFDEPQPEPEMEPESDLVMHGRVLLAEDNPLNRRVTLVALQKAGFLVEVATNGAEAFAAVTSGVYDAVLMDCEMPVLDGFEAATRIRMSEAGGRRTPIIALTVHTSHDDQLRAAAAGMDDFIAKPFETRELLIKLSRWVPQHA